MGEPIDIYMPTKTHDYMKIHTQYLPSILQRWAIVPPSIIALIISAAILSKRSAPRAAQSPTLSPTLIAKLNKYKFLYSQQLRQRR